VTALSAEVTRAREVTATAEAAHVVAVLAAEASAQEAVVERDNAALHVKDAEEWAALVEREALEGVSRVEVENTVALAFARDDAEGFVQKISLLEGELVVERVREASERERREQFEELTLLQTQGSELCHVIIGPPQTRHHLSEGMRLAALRHTEMAGELAVLWAAVSSTTESVLGRSPNNTFRLEVVGELAVEF
jgi:hypothetical protein